MQTPFLQQQNIPDKQLSKKAAVCIWMECGNTCKMQHLSQKFQNFFQNLMNLLNNMYCVYSMCKKVKTIKIQ